MELRGMFFDRLYILEDRIAEPLEGCFLREASTLREAPTINRPGRQAQKL
jgi:hypothetical protein